MGEVVSIKKQSAVRQHNEMLRKRVLGVPACAGTAESAADPLNPNVEIAEPCLAMEQSRPVGPTRTG